MPAWADFFSQMTRGLHLGEVVDAVGRRHVVGVREDYEEGGTVQHDVDAQKQTPVFVRSPENSRQCFLFVCLCGVVYVCEVGHEYSQRSV